MEKENILATKFGGKRVEKIEEKRMTKIFLGEERRERKKERQQIEEGRWKIERNDRKEYRKMSGRECGIGYYFEEQENQCEKCGKQCAECCYRKNDCRECEELFHYPLSSLSHSVSHLRFLQLSSSCNHSCHYSCLSCLNPGYGHCLSCPPSRKLVKINSNFISGHCECEKGGTDQYYPTCVST